MKRAFGAFEAFNVSPAIKCLPDSALKILGFSSRNSLVGDLSGGLYGFK
jgi:hypothetical protein